MSSNRARSENQTEEEDLRFKMGSGLLCAICREQISSQKFLIEHVKGRHCELDSGFSRTQSEDYHELLNSQVVF